MSLAPEDQPWDVIALPGLRAREMPSDHDYF